MKGIFVELPPFERHRADYLPDDEYRGLQEVLMANPEAGDVIAGTGGLRKIRFGDRRRGKGKRGGMRVIYYYWIAGPQFWLFTVYDKDEMSDLSSGERKLLAKLLEAQIRKRDGVRHEQEEKPVR